MLRKHTIVRNRNRKGREALSGMLKEGEKDVENERFCTQGSSTVRRCSFQAGDRARLEASRLYRLEARKSKWYALVISPDGGVSSGPRLSLGSAGSPRGPFLVGEKRYFPLR